MAGRAEGAADATSLTRREREVLGAIGRRLTNAELASEFHVSIRTIESHVAALRRKLDATSRSELIDTANQLARAAAVAGPDSSFVGRDDELAGLEARITSDRLVTLLGPAGVGKSRLARELSRRSQREVRLVDLVGVAADAVAVAVADALGVAAAEGTDVEGGVRLAVADRNLLLVIDNADEVTAAVGTLAQRLVDSTPALRILVTSRRRLGLPAESVHHVAPLAVSADPASDPLDSPAVRLLVDRARSVRSDFAIEPSDRTAVVSLCRRLDGLPLALELAAARLASMAVAELDAVVAERIDVLGQPDADGRHRSLVATIESSLAGLTKAEQLVLTVVASLPGPATLEELRAVVDAARPASDEPIDTARVVLDLVDRSLLQPRLRPGATTYRTLETIRSVVSEGADPALAHLARASHARHHADRLSVAVDRARSGDGWDYEDDAARRALLGAMRWAAEHDVDLGARLLTGVAERYELAPTVAVLDATRRVVLDHAIPDGWPTRPLAWAAVVLNYLDLELMDRVAAVALERATTDAERAIGQWAVGFAAGYLGREAEALDALAEAEREFTAAGDDLMVGLTLMAEGLVRSDPARSAATLESALMACLQAGSHWHANLIRLTLTRRAIEAGLRLDEVPIWLEASDEFGRRDESLRLDRAHALAVRAEWAALVDASDSTGGANELAKQSAEAFRRHGDLRCLVRALLLEARTEVHPASALVAARRAVDAAVLQGDRRAQLTALEAVVELAHAAGESIVEARARGAVHLLEGRPTPPADGLTGPTRTAVLEGFAQGPRLIALGPDDGADLS